MTKINQIDFFAPEPLKVAASDVTICNTKRQSSKTKMKKHKHFLIKHKLI